MRIVNELLKLRSTPNKLNCETWTLNIVFIYSTSINQQRNEWHNIKWDAFFAPNYPFVGHIYCQWDAKFQYFKLTNFQQLEREPEWMAAVNETISMLVSATPLLALWWNVMSSARLYKTQSFDFSFSYLLKFLSFRFVPFFILEEKLFST